MHVLINKNKTKKGMILKLTYFIEKSLLIETKNNNSLLWTSQHVTNISLPILTLSTINTLNFYF